MVISWSTEFEVDRHRKKDRRAYEKKVERRDEENRFNRCPWRTEITEDSTNYKMTHESRNDTGLEILKQSILVLVQ